MILLDIDGVIVDMRKRWLALQSGALTFEQYSTAFHMDTAIPQGVALYKSLLQTYNDCTFFTAREEHQREGTRGQLEAFLKVSNPKLIMRNNGMPYTPTTKLEMMAKNGITPADVLFAVDDDPNMVNSYVAVGITVLQFHQK